MRHYRYMTVLLTIFGFIACHQDNNTTGKTTAGAKFEPLPAYFNGEREHIRAGGFSLHKIITLNGVSDTATVNGTDSTAVRDLLKPFADIDLNKPSLRDQYDTSSLYDPFSGRKSVIYKSKGKQTFPSEITMELDKNGTIQQVNIHSYTVNMVYEFRQDLLYQRNKNIRIATYQKIAFLSPKEIEVNVTVTPKTRM
ncbi:hypothetical protein SAMN04488128_102892 [Chitinophaga eiseniae]|uniref:Uncharacterized protein n=1 Tax=Chitinophaga eiseniae TaxID=634771 RepID=A0A1T4R6S8_9BACT|nr:hypothetical protein [Chitinophaga eiseniae]SKA11597.1 hypothetical protein SAMN04488128_102892 [Chitinophaga eiseniae]